MPSDWEYSVAFRVHHPEVDPARISQSLGWKTQRAWRAGEQRRDGAGRPLPGKYTKSYCTFDLTTARHVPLGELLRRALAHLHGHKELLSELVANGGRLEFFVGLYVTKGSGDELAPDIMTGCGELGIALALLVSPFKMPKYGEKKVNQLRAVDRRVRRGRT